MVVSGLYNEKGRSQMPLNGVHVAVRVVNFVAEVQVVQFYVNDSPDKIDCVYEFPIDDCGAVCGFEVEMSDRLLIGEIREKEQARREYSRAIAQGQSAALLEENKPDIFIQRIGNIPPYSRLNIRVTYVTELAVEVETGGAIFALPTSVAPRYSPYNDTSRPISWARRWQDVCIGRRGDLGNADWNGRVETLPWQSWTSHVPKNIVDREAPAAFSATIEIEMASEVLSVESGTHKLNAQVDGGSKAYASLWNETELMGRDLSITIYQTKPHDPSVELELQSDGSGCAMLTLIPEFECDPESTEIVFLVDCSGSMGGAKMGAAKRALQTFLTSLPLSCHFNIYAFGSSFKSLFERSAKYTQVSVDDAKRFVENLSANLGGTELAAPLRQIFSSQVALGARTRQLFALTDGEVSNTEEVIRLCRINASNTRVFTVGIGNEVSRHLVQGMSRAATGTCEIILGTELQSSSSALDRKLMNQLKLATLPSITKIDVDWWGGKSTASFVDRKMPEPQLVSSKFFPTGPAQKGTGAMTFSGQVPSQRDSSEHAVGSGAAAALLQQQRTNDSFHQAPFLPPPLFSGGKFVMYAFLTPNQVNTRDVVNVTADAPGGQLHIQVPVIKVKSLGRTVHLLAARSLIRDLTDGTSHLHWEKRVTSEVTRPFTSFSSWIGGSPQDRGSAWELQPCQPVQTVVANEGIKIGQMYGIVSQWTSFVAVERWLDGRSGIAKTPPPLPMEQSDDDRLHLLNDAALALRSGRVSLMMENIDSQLNSIQLCQDLSVSSASLNDQAAQFYRKSSATSYGSSIGAATGTVVASFKSMATGFQQFFMPAPSAVESNKRAPNIESMPRAAPSARSDPENTEQTIVFKSMDGCLAPPKVGSASLATPILVHTFSNLLACQRYDGSFDGKDPGLALQLETTLGELANSAASKARTVVGTGIEEDVLLQIWVAIVVLSVLNRKYASSKDIWELSADKTKQWLAKTLAPYATSSTCAKEMINKLSAVA